MKVWLDATALRGLADGDLVNVWPDKSGLGNDALQDVSAHQPAYRIGRIKSATMPAVQFGSASGLNAPANLFSANTSEFTIFIAARRRWGGHQPAPNANGYLFGVSKLGTGSGGDSYAIGGDINIGGQGWAVEIYKSGAADISVRGTLGDQSPRLFLFGYDGSNLALTVDNVTSSVSTGNLTSIDLRNALTIGAFNASGTYVAGWSGDIYEVLVYDRNLTGGEKTNVTTYLNNKWGLPYSGYWFDGPGPTPDSSHHYQSPAFFVADDKTFRMLFREDISDVTTPNRLLESHSSDNGVTWSTPAEMVPDPGYTIFNGDGGAVGKIGTAKWLWHYYTENAGTLSTVHSYIRMSTDDGATWGPPVDPGLFGYSWVSLYGKPYLRSNGDIIIGGYGQRGAGNVEVFTVKTSDGGSNWTKDKIVDSTNTATNEAAIAWFDDAKGAVLIRDSTTDDRYWIRQTTDGGATWTNRTLAFITALSIGFPGLWVGPGNVLVATFRGGGKSFALSYDGGTTWIGPVGDGVGPMNSGYQGTSAVFYNGNLYIASALTANTLGSGLWIHGRAWGNWT
ncbi:exo-alpha-sialidase [Candidatus Micrarchaeota archaeon]|nr:exo-alpha-sialidase [Candidatus Micrarchaeota archaeon]